MAHISIPWKTFLHYKTKLNQQDKDIYTAILDGLLDWKKRIPIPTASDSDHIYDIFTMVLRDVPMLFHVSNGLRISTGLYSYVVPEYIMDERTYEKYFALVVAFLKNCKALLTKHEPFNKLQIIHDSIVQHVEYHNTETHNEHNILGTILDKKAVCESIAKSYKLLCDFCMIPAIVVFGYSNANNQSVQRTTPSVYSSTPEDNHAWNIVRLDEKWYNVDLTFDVTLGDFDSFTAFRYDYFLRSDSVFNLEHYPSQKELLPQCPADFNLYKKLDQHVQTVADVASVIKAALRKKNNARTIIFGVDTSTGLTERKVASTVSTTCFLNGKSASSYTYNERTGVFCVILE